MDDHIVVDAGIDPRVGRWLTHLEFRRKFTKTEREWADELEVTFETNPLFTSDQKKALRTGYKDFNMASGVNLDDEDVLQMLQLFVVLGGLSPSRIPEILA